MSVLMAGPPTLPPLRTAVIWNTRWSKSSAQTQTHTDLCVGFVVVSYVQTEISYDQQSELNSHGICSHRGAATRRVTSLNHLGHWWSQGTPVRVLYENQTFPDPVLKSLHASMRSTMHEDIQWCERDRGPVQWSMQSRKSRFQTIEINDCVTVN